MQLSVYVQGREVATLEQAGDFKSVLSYHPQTAADDLVSLTMPVRLESYVWDDQLPPVLQMNLPEGYLLQVLQEGDWSKEAISAGFKQVLKTHGIKMPQLAMPVRVLAVGTAHTPSVDAVLALLGREKIIERLQKR